MGTSRTVRLLTAVIFFGIILSGTVFFGIPVLISSSSGYVETPYHADASLPENPVRW